MKKSLIGLLSITALALTSGTLGLAAPARPIAAPLMILRPNLKVMSSLSDLYTDPGTGLLRVRFHIHPVRRRPVMLTCDAPVADFREVRDSGGHSERRPFIRTTATAGAHAWAIDLSLTNREGMRFRMLLGRGAVAGRFTIDPARSYLLGPKLSRAYR